MKNKKIKNLVISLGLVATYVSLTLLVFNGNTNGLGTGFGWSVIYIITRNIALVSAGIALILRLIKVIKDQTSLLYVLLGTLNLCIGIICLELYILKLVDMQWLHKCLLNTMVGFSILIDVFFFEGIKHGDKKAN